MILFSDACAFGVISIPPFFSVLMFVMSSLCSSFMIFVICVGFFVLLMLSMITVCIGRLVSPDFVLSFVVSDVSVVLDVFLSWSA